MTRLIRYQACMVMQCNEQREGGGAGGRRYSPETLESVAAFDEDTTPLELIEGACVSV